MGGVKKRMSLLTEVEDLVGVSIISNTTATAHEGPIRAADADESQAWLCLRVIVTGAVTLAALTACVSMLVVNEVFAAKVRAIVSDHTLRGSDLGGTNGAHAHFEHELHVTLESARTWGFAVCALVAATCGTLGWVLGNAVSCPVLEVCHVVDQLCELGVTGKADVVDSLRTGSVSRIDEAVRLQRAFSRLLLSIETFARHLPETVVQRIVRGDERANRLHVSRRTATIMFSDIANFTQISESLEQEDVLLLLTRYFSIMTRIVELYGGVVAEILGDGLLAYWNAPDDVDDHPSRACAAALAQQQVLASLNAEFESLSLPPLRLRIGIHTGSVLAGNIGSETKMKWGCIGDAVNLASRLESLCKLYEVGILCSEGTRHALPEGTGIFCRKLDLVQVKGKKKPTEIYEVLGLLEDNEEDYFSDGGHRYKPFTTKCVSLTAKEAMRDSARALQAFDMFHPRRAASRRLSQASNGTKVSPRVSPRSKIYEVQIQAETSRKDLRAAPRETSRPSCKSVAGDSTQSSPLCGRKTSSLGESQVVDPETRKRAECYEQALRAYQGARFAEARDLARSSLDGDVPDRAASLLMERAIQSLGTVLSEDELTAWIGVRIMHEK
jgi:class 3 adenylate cyclase